jgi:hypothetical protein
VEIALQPLALLLSRLDHSRARALQLFQMRLLLRLETTVLERHRGGRPYRGEQLGLVIQLGVMQKRRHVRAVAVDQRRRPVASRLG